MIKKAYEAIEGITFDIMVRITVPALIWWTNYGLHREDLTEELVEFWRDYNA